MKKIIILCAFFLFPTLSFSADTVGLPACAAKLIDSIGMPISSLKWKEDFFMGSISGASNTVLISTSLGYDQVMSLWVREKKESNPAGMFSFVDLSSGRSQYLNFYMADGYSVAVTCVWSSYQ